MSGFRKAHISDAVREVSSSVHLSGNLFQDIKIAVISDSNIVVLLVVEFVVVTVALEHILEKIFIS